MFSLNIITVIVRVKKNIYEYLASYIILKGMLAFYE